MRLALAIALGLGLLAAAPARAQGTFEVVGKVLLDGKGVAGAKLAVINKDNATVRRDGTTDKRGNFFVDGVPYSQQNRLFKMTVEAPGLVVTKAKVVGRMGNGAIYDEYERVLGPGAPPLEFRAMGIGEVRIEFTMADAAAATPATTPGPASAAAQPGAAGAPSDDPYVLGNQKLAAGDLEGGLALLQQAVAAAPTDPERRELVARVLLKLERPGEALQQALKAVEAAPDRPSARLAAADSYATLGNMEKARLQLVEAQRLSPDDVKTLQRLARVSIEAKKLPEAIAAYEAIARIQPANVEAWMSLGDMYHETGQPEKSAEAYAKVAELDPKNAYKTFFNIGALIENREDISEADNRKAIEAFRKAIEIKPDYAAAHKHLAYALLRQGDMKGAKQSFQRYLELEPRAEDAGEIRGVIKSLP